MILCLDLGNTALKAGLFAPDGARLWDARLGPSTATLPALSFLEEEKALTDFFSAVKNKPIEKVVLSSVAPSKNKFLQNLFPSLVLVDPSSPWDFKIAVENPETLGSDRLANIQGALRFGGYALIIDAGTATKFDLLEGSSGAGERKFVGGAIAPGMNIAYEALLARTEKLPPISLEKFSPVVGYNTETAIRSGVLHGFAAQVDGMVMKIFTERNLPTQTSVIATGGNARYLQGRCRLVTHQVPHLALEGLYAIAKKI